MTEENRPLIKFRPMKSATPEQDFDYGSLAWPMLASPKIDGIRCVIHPYSGPVTNTLLPIPNNHIREKLKVLGSAAHYLDGELIVGDPTNPRSFNNTQSGVMSQGGEPNFTFLAFDHFGFHYSFAARQHLLTEAVKQLDVPYIRKVEQTMLQNVDEMLKYEEEQLGLGYEGIMLRFPAGGYKFGRSTLREQLLVKVKRFADDEALIIGWEPLMRNENEAVIDNLGLQRRGYSKDGKFVDDTMVGKFIVIGTIGRWSGVTFKIGSGLDEDDRLKFRAEIAQHPNFLPYVTYLDAIKHADDWPMNIPIGHTISYKYQPHGSLNAPRTPIWKGIRHG